MPKKTKNQNKSIQSECLVKFALKNVALNMKNLFFFIINVYQLWEHLLEQIINDKFNHP
jgi:hypothetical protein